MLVDTRVLVRTLQPHHPLYTLADGAIRLLPARGEKLHIVAQLWVVATRPLGEHGLGMNPAEAIYPAWEAQVLEHAVSGKIGWHAAILAQRGVGRSADTARAGACAT